MEVKLKSAVYIGVINLVLIVLLMLLDCGWIYLYSRPRLPDNENGTTDNEKGTTWQPEPPYSQVYIGYIYVVFWPQIVFMLHGIMALLYHKSGSRKMISAYAGTSVLAMAAALVKTVFTFFDAARLPMYISGSPPWDRPDIKREYLKIMFPMSCVQVALSLLEVLCCLITWISIGIYVWVNRQMCFDRAFGACIKKYLKLSEDEGKQQSVTISLGGGNMERDDGRQPTIIHAHTLIINNYSGQDIEKFISHGSEDVIKPQERESTEACTQTDTMEIQLF